MTKGRGTADDDDHDVLEVPIERLVDRVSGYRLLNGALTSTPELQQRVAQFGRQMGLLPDAGGKPLPSFVQKSEDKDLEALAGSAGINEQLGRIVGQIDSGALELGPLSNRLSEARNYLGSSTDQSRNYASLNSTLETLRNASLRLNAGVQTDGDAKRAWNELITNINDPALVKQRIQEITALNDLAVELKTNMINLRRRNAQAPELDVTSVVPQLGIPKEQSRPQPTPAQQIVRVASDEDYNRLPSGAVFIDPPRESAEEAVMAAWEEAPLIGGGNGQSSGTATAARPAWESAPLVDREPQQQKGLMDTVRNLFTGEDRQTRATQKLPELQNSGLFKGLDIPAGQQAALFAALPTTTDAGEIAKMLRASSPYIGVSQDEKGNLIAANNKTGVQAVINKPGLSGLDVAQAAGIGAAFTPQREGHPGLVVDWGARPLPWGRDLQRLRLESKGCSRKLVGMLMGRDSCCWRPGRCNPGCRQCYWWCRRYRTEGAGRCAKPGGRSERATRSAG
ncbi:hypothetical protein N5K55_05790 [Pseudomonas aeruginosa]|nr:hypothetical protein [Pseudomonas aeruginosa]